MRRLPTLSLLALLLVGPAPGWTQEAPRPNIVIVLVDDMGFSDVGCYGGEIETPTIDALAAGGVRFSQFRNTARCCPTRAMLMTGLHPHQAGIGWMTLGPNRMPDPNQPPAYQGFLNEHCVTMAEILKTAGYATFMAGKWHLGRHDESLWPLQQGFDRFWGSVSGAFNFFQPKHPRGIHDGNTPIEVPDSTTERRFYTTDAFTDHAMRFVGEHLAASEDPAPFFLYLAYNAPHWPMQAHEEDIAKYRGRYRLGWDELRRQRYARQLEIGLIDASWPLSERDGPAPAWEELDEAKQDEMDLRVAIYAAMVDSVDQNLTRFVDFLKDAEVFDDTLILFLSDNGGCAEGGVLGNFDIYDVEARNASYNIAYGLAWANASNTPFRLYKHWSHEGGVATPFIAHWPRGLDAREQWVREPAQLLDVMPTILELTGARYPSEVEGHAIHPLLGVSLLPALRGQPLTRSLPMFNEHEGHGSMQDGRWKLVGLNVARREGYDPEPWELYDLEEDRTELHDLAEVHPERLAAMASAWEAWAHEVGVFPKTYDPVARDPSLRLDRRRLVVRVNVDAGDGAHGVLIAQGGSTHGISLRLDQGVPVFDLRRDGALQSLRAEQAVRGKVRLEARLTSTTLELWGDGQLLASMPSGGLMPSQPAEAREVGQDGGSSVGDYASPEAFAGGTILRTHVQSLPAASSSR